MKLHSKITKFTICVTGFEEKNLQISDLFSLRGPGAIWANLQSKISPRLLNIFSSGFFYSKTMTLLHEIRTFPALSEGV